MKTLLVNILGDQTTPNIQFINEFYTADSDLLFISTKKMEEKGVGKWIKKACNIPPTKIQTVCINEYSTVEDISQKLDQYDLDQYDKKLVNVTGGTKLLSMSVSEYFKSLGADIFYLTGKNKDVVRLFPKTKSPTTKLRGSLSLLMYLDGHGINRNESDPSSIPTDYTSRFFHWFVEDRTLENKQIIKDLQKLRSKIKQKEDISKIDGLKGFLKEIEFPAADPQFINKNEVEYLTGNWFEEYVYNRLQEELQLNVNIQTGTKISIDSVPNELDVLFVYNDRLYVIECKTSHETKIGEKNKSIINQTIYKAKAIQKNLGLHCTYFIFTLGKQESLTKDHLDRAKLFDIKVCAREDIVKTEKLSDLLNLC